MTGRWRLVLLGAILLGAALPILMLRSPPPRTVAPATIRLVVRPASARIGPALIGSMGQAATPVAIGSGPPVPVGIVGRLPDDVQAMVRLADGSVRTIVPGDRIGDWTLAGIEPDRLRFRRGDEERVSVLPASADQ